MTDSANFQRRTVHSFIELVGALGKDDPDQLDPSHIRRYADISTSKSYAVIYPQLAKGELLAKDSSGIYVDLWKNASAEKF